LVALSICPRVEIMFNPAPKIVKAGCTTFGQFCQGLPAR
jgi:hypothetical protein